MLMPKEVAPAEYRLIKGRGGETRNSRVQGDWTAVYPQESIGERL